MRLVLKDFQEESVSRLKSELSLARHEVDVAKKSQALSLTSSTGSGKTVILTALIESLIDGSGDTPPDPEATFLWITDQPELNEQTRNKMASHSSRLWMGGLEILSAAFDREVFSPKVVYFLNTQKLGKDKTLITPGDNRTYTIWETIRNTIAARPSSFYVIIDEAHRGMKESPVSRKLAATIVQKFIKGSDGEIPPVPLIIGLSATPERFQTLIAGTGRTVRPVDVPPSDVRGSGLLKKTIALWYPSEDQPGDTSMLRAAAQKWKSYQRRWTTYCKLEEEHPVRPILVVQVQDGSKKKLSATDIGAAINAINEEVGPLEAHAFAHAFEDHTVIEAGRHDIRYLAPAAIDRDPDVTVVFFKSSLNTGWDCPRAEVMMSFRKAKDATLIAQLVGRMVRTPLARSVGTDEMLNAVSLYLPHYDEAGLDRVIAHLTAPDAEIIGPVDVEKGTDRIELERDKSLSRCFEATDGVPTYVIPKLHKSTELRRLMKLARQLSNTAIDDDAPEKARSEVVDFIIQSLEAKRNTSQFMDTVSDVVALDVKARVHDIETGKATEKSGKLAVSADNIKDLFEAVGRQLGDGLHKEYLRERCASGAAPNDARVELAALVNVDEETVDGLENLASDRVRDWFEKHGTAIKILDDGDRQIFWQIRGLATKPESTTMSNLPTRDAVRRVDTTWKRHLYCDANGDFPVTLNTWERIVLKEETERVDFVGWLRNPPRKDWSLCVPYDKGGIPTALYPDFLLFRESDGEIVVDILDPHSESFADAPGKAKGLAQFADRHLMDFGRIELISVKDGKARRLDLLNDDVRARVRDISSGTQLESLFGSA